MLLDREKFFDIVRVAPFNGRLTQGQVDGMEFLLDNVPDALTLDQIAYCFATPVVETDWTMLPIEEYGSDAYFTSRYGIEGDNPSLAEDLGNTEPGDGAKYHGRGFVMITGKANYEKLTDRLHVLELLEPELDLVVDPDLALDAEISSDILYIGMTEGLFTGKKLSTYFNDSKCDPVGARYIVNGQDRAQEIAGYWDNFRGAFEASVYGEEVA